MSFDSKCHQLKSLKVCLNPFRSGQCLSTEDIIMSSLKSRFVSIPFDQGNVFRQYQSKELTWIITSQSLSIRAMSFDAVKRVNYAIDYESQSLSIRAMSFDFVHFYLLLLLLLSQSLSSRAMSFDCSGMLEAGIMRPFRPTSQFFWKVKELALDLSK